MSKLLRITTLAASAAALTLAAAPAAAQQVSPGNGRNATATARIVKPLTLEWQQDLDLGSIILSSGTWTGAVVGISRGGVPSCANTNVTCTGTMTTARYLITGTNNQTVRINVNDVVMTNQNDLVSTLTLDVDSPGTVSLGNSGAAGLPFDLGGSIVVDASTPEGTYLGTFDVTVEYN